MGEDNLGYIDGKFEELRKDIKNDLKWAAGIVSGLLSTILVIYGLQIHKLNLDQQEQKFNLRVLQASYDDMAWKQSWLIEISEVEKKFIKTLSEDGDVDDLIDEISNIKLRMMNGDSPLPTFRGD